MGDHVVHVELNRPEKLNTYSKDMWREIRECFVTISQDPSCRAIVLSGSGRLFSAGLDMSAMTEFAPKEDEETDVARTALGIRATGKAWQASFNAIEEVEQTLRALQVSASNSRRSGSVGSLFWPACTVPALGQLWR